MLPGNETIETPMPRKTPPKAGRPRLYKTAAARQAAYRTRAMRGEGGIATQTDDPGQGAGRLDLFLPTNARFALRRLAKRTGQSQAQVLTDLLMKADRRVVARLTEDE